MVQHRTEQLERGQAIEGSRNRILEMLVSNEPLPAVLDAIARAAREQAPGAVCLVLVKRLQDARRGNEFRRCGAGGSGELAGGDPASGGPCRSSVATAL